MNAADADADPNYSRETFDIKIPHGTTAASTAAIYQNAFPRTYDFIMEVLLEEIKKATTNGYYLPAFMYFRRQPHVVYAIAYFVAQKYDFDVILYASGDLDLHVYVRNASVCSDAFTQRDSTRYFHFRQPMSNEAIEERMDIVHRALFHTSVLAATHPEESASTPTPPSTALHASASMPHPDGCPVTPADSSVAAPARFRTSSSFFLSWFLVSLVLYVLAVLLHP